MVLIYAADPLFRCTFHCNDGTDAGELRERQASGVSAQQE